jgi:predicted nucleic acid-binding protein
MSAERFSLDTNILVYAIDARESTRRELAAAIIEKAVTRDCALALQALGEFTVAATSKLKLDPRDAARRAEQLMLSFETFAHSPSAMRAALEEASKGRFSLWDGVLLASAAEAGCTRILSEDMADGARFGSIVVTNPFGAKGLSPRAKDLLGL